jgi:hypothetical protein
MVSWRHRNSGRDRRNGKQQKKEELHNDRAVRLQYVSDDATECSVSYTRCDCQLWPSEGLENVVSRLSNELRVE